MEILAARLVGEVVLRRNAGVKTWCCCSMTCVFAVSVPFANFNCWFLRLINWKFHAGVVKAIEYNPLRMSAGSKADEKVVMSKTRWLNSELEVLFLMHHSERKRAKAVDRDRFLISLPKTLGYICDIGMVRVEVDSEADVVVPDR